MIIMPLPRQRVYCSANDFWHFLKLLFCGKWIQGNSIIEFERNFSRNFSAQYALAACSCRSVFALILDGLGLKEGDEVIVPAFNLSVLPKVLVFKGIKPVFVDINENTLNIDPEKIESSITPKTKAILAVHLFGNCCDIKKICAIAKKYHLAVIEDCANAFMAKYDGRFVGTFGDVACFSLSHSKDLPTFGGGILITNNRELFEKISEYFERDYKFPRRRDMVKMFTKSLILKVTTTSVIFSIFIYPVIFICSLFGIDLVAHFISDKDMKIKGICQKRFTNVQAAIGIRKLRTKNEMQEQRIAIAERLNRELSDIKNIRLPLLVENGNHVYLNYVLLAENRALLLRQLNFRGIDVKRISDYDCNNYKIFREYQRECPISKGIAEKIFALPMYHSLKDSDIDHMTSAISDHLNWSSL